jgi:poly-gamma-glutamate capsule biosynthesis protein CapA/YwtB (metallophosphatase superfamily)
MCRNSKRIRAAGDEWHDSNMSVLKTALLTLTLFGAGLVNLAAAAPVLVHGRVVDEAGDPVADATLLSGGTKLEVSSSGEFALSLNTATTVRISVSAPGYYTFLQTLHRSDFVPGREAILPDLELVQKKPGRTLLMFAGDSMLSRRYFEPRDAEPTLVRQASILDDGKKLLAHIRPYVELADYASVNMETQLSTDELTNRVPKSVTFYSPAELAELLQWAGFDYVALGNNHMYDYRDAGLSSTFAALEGTGLAYSGAGVNEAAARKPVSVDINDREHWFMSYVGWAGTFEPSQVAEPTKGGAALGNTAVIATDLDGLPTGSISVLQLHAGLEYAENPALSERTTLRQAVVDGADVAIGHHPHVLQGFEIYRDRLIAYSLGNFLFDQYHYTTQLGMLLYVWMDGDTLHRAEVVPLHINGYLPTPAIGTFRHAVLTRLARLSDAGVCMHASGFHAIVESCKDKERMTSLITIPDSASGAPMHVRSLGASPLRPLTIDSGDRPYRLGLDLLRRGDFEYARLYGAHDRTWIEGSNASLKTGDNNRLEIRVPANGQSVRSGMKVFERVFTLSSPATVSGRISVDGNVRVRFLLQRRRPSDTLDDALINGPMTEIGVWEGSAADWGEFSFDYNQPRIATTSVRLLIDVVDISDDKAGATVSFDDLAWVEWQTAWIGPDDYDGEAEFATHVMLRSKATP